MTAWTRRQLASWLFRAWSDHGDLYLLAFSFVQWQLDPTLAVVVHTPIPDVGCARQHSQTQYTRNELTCFMEASSQPGKTIEK